MALATKRLTARAVATISKPGRHADGDGLYLIVDPSGARRWLFLFRWQGKLKEMGLGGISAVSLAEAREKAADARRVLAGGRNPIEVRRVGEQASSATVTFGAFADQLVDGIARGFRNAKHVAQWRMTLAKYAAPLRAKPIDQVGTDDVLAVLAPLWTTKSETASRLRGRIERVLDAAKAKGLRQGENPARWRGHLDHLLPKRRKLTRGHHAAMPYADLPAFVAHLRTRRATAAMALEFLILTAGRSGEVLGARWDEIDRGAAVWHIPGSRMKAGVDHRVPLCGRALEILTEAEPFRTGEYVFPGQQRGRPLSNMALEMVLRRLAVPFTVHGFRSSFRDWVGDCTVYPREIAEAALAHSVGNATELAYRRSDALQRRRELMDAWQSYVEITAS